jgi:hypothetical protein
MYPPYVVYVSFYEYLHQIAKLRMKGNGSCFIASENIRPKYKYDLSLNDIYKKDFKVLTQRYTDVNTLKYLIISLNHRNNGFRIRSNSQ